LVWWIRIQFHGLKCKEEGRANTDQGSETGRNAKDKSFCAWIIEPEIVNSRVPRLVMNSLRKAEQENLRLVINEPALEPSIEEWLVTEVLHYGTGRVASLGSTTSGR
jgi:hypothetical protein